ncbi:uncharacterized protein LOC116345303 isoform X2 [Contarinia nasturtii]|uniref:uncharacterized protein LOC116345303 isoform X2 n=1 Tax=Contarinia nasturtii TaxID=265458 RepID=UPI0012D416DC|nr:uncharacterized protein LOC116345303 isoform X2 [Contarinia nasturtii]
MLNHKILILIVGVIVFMDVLQALDSNTPLLRFNPNNCDLVVEAEALKERGGLVWKRPNTYDTQFPHTWHTFKAKNTSGDEVEFIIKDIPRNRYNEVVDLMALYTLRYKPIYKTLSLWSDADAVKYLKKQWGLVLQQQMSVACFRNDGSDDIIGINILAVQRKDDVMYKLLPSVESYNLRVLFGFMRDLYEFDLFGHYKVDEFLGSFGIGIDPKYANFGIDAEFLKIRQEICRNFGIKLTSTIFTSPESNALANDIHFKMDKGLSFAKMHEVIPEFPYVNRWGMALRSIHFGKKTNRYNYSTFK